MAGKSLRYETAARQSLERGINKLVGAVKVTLGPKGRYVVLGQLFGLPTVTNDGVTIAKQIELKDVFENQGVQLVLEVATKTNDVAGDGTTTALVLAQAIVSEGTRNVAAGANSVFLRGGIEKAAEVALEEIQKQSTEVSGRDEVARVGAISARNQEIGDIIAEAFEKVGKDGVVNVEEGQTLGMELEFAEGMYFDKGYTSPYFVTDQDRMEAVLDEPYILIANQKISNLQEILPLLNQVMQSNKPLLIISDDLDGEALSTLIVNKMRGTFNVASVRAPTFGDRRKRELEDIAILTDGQVITEELGLKLEDAEVSQLGQARRVVINKDGTTIIDGAGDTEQIQNRIAQIRRELEITTSEFDREKLQGRLAKLSGGVAVVQVGAATEVEMKERKHRVEDALSATRAALEEGIVPGGGVALLKAQAAVGEFLETLDGDERTGARIVYRALEEPVRRIAVNAGSDGSIVVDKVRTRGEGIGFNALTGEYEDLAAAGIIDPAKVTRSALQNACSIGSLIITTEAIVAEAPERGAAAGSAEVMRSGMNMDLM